MMALRKDVMPVAHWMEEAGAAETEGCLPEG